MPNNIEMPSLDTLDTFVKCWNMTADIKGWEIYDVDVVKFIRDGDLSVFTRTNGIRDEARTIDRLKLLPELFSKILCVTASYANDNVVKTSNVLLNELLKYFKDKPYDENKIQPLIDYLNQVINKCEEELKKMKNMQPIIQLHLLLDDSGEITRIANNTEDKSVGPRIAGEIMKYMDAVRSLEQVQSGPGR